MTWTLPNILTVLRLLAAPGLAVMFLYFHRPAADFLALALFLSAAITDFFDGYLARLWKQESKFGAMLDPIADKAMVAIALLVIVGYSGMSPWLILPATLILFREMFVSGLREFLGAASATLKVTRLAKWKTTVQMVAIAILFAASGFETLHLSYYRVLDPSDYDRQLLQGPDDWNRLWLTAQAGWYTGLAGLALIWTAALLTAVTGWEYFRKALPFLRDGGAK